MILPRSSGMDSSPFTYVDGRGVGWAELKGERAPTISLMYFSLLSSFSC